ncbi:MAG: DegT/DnrJ/EryC1/StrS family aminotransferase [Desulfarculus sp.]|nr:DegT/DnrJ/EryC1/StrS family aminotransferase [Desulfarculus sp.]
MRPEPAYRIPFSGRAHRYTQAEVDLVARVMQEADPLTQGRHLREFEAAFAAYIGAPHCFATNNATNALELAAQLCELKPGDEVIVPAHTFTSSAYPFAKQGARLVWADSDRATRVVTAQMIADKLTPRTKVIVVVHLYGYAAQMPEIMDLARRHDLIVVEDVAQALGAEVAGRKAGTFGDLGVISFHSHKNVTTLGEGGMLVVKDPAKAALVPLLRHNGHCAFDSPREHYWTPAMGNLDLPRPGLWPSNYCLGEVECALGTELLTRIDQMNADKRVRACRFIDALGDHPELQFHRVDSTRHTYHLLAAYMDERGRPGLRDAFMERMAFEKLIKCVVQYYPLYRYPLYAKNGFGQASCPGADDFFDHMVSFPFQHWLSDEDLDYMLASTREVLEDLSR